MRDRARWLATPLVFLLGLAFSLYLVRGLAFEVLGLFTIAGWAAVLALIPTFALIAYVTLTRGALRRVRRGASWPR